MVSFKFCKYLIDFTLVGNRSNIMWHCFVRSISKIFEVKTLHKLADPGHQIDGKATFAEYEESEESL